MILAESLYYLMSHRSLISESLEYAERAKNVYAQTSAGLKAKLDDAQKREKEAAEAAETKRLKDIADAAQATIDAEKAAEDKRKANEAHNKKVNGEAAQAIQDILAASMFKDGEADLVRTANLVVVAIIEGKIPHTTIKY